MFQIQSYLNLNPKSPTLSLLQKLRDETVMPGSVHKKRSYIGLDHFNLQVILLVDNEMTPTPIITNKKNGAKRPEQVVRM